MLFSCGEEELLSVLTKSAYPRVVVTMGGDGAVCLENGKVTVIPAIPSTVVDTTGAGDCFNGVLCAMLMEKYSLEEAVKQAVSAASLSVQFAHVLDGMPYRKDLLI